MYFFLLFRNSDTNLIAEPTKGFPIVSFWRYQLLNLFLIATVWLHLSLIFYRLKNVNMKSRYFIYTTYQWTFFSQQCRSQNYLQKLYISQGMVWKQESNLQHLHVLYHSINKKTALKSVSALNFQDKSKYHYSSFRELTESLDSMLYKMLFNFHVCLFGFFSFSVWDYKDIM